MEKAVVIDSSTSASALQLGRPHCGLPMKRKTPSELRGEQLKRKNGGTLSVDKLATRPPLESGMKNGFKKPKSVKDAKSGVEIPSDLDNSRVAENFKLENMTTLSCGKIDASTKLECSDSSNKATDDQGDVVNEDDIKLPNRSEASTETPSKMTNMFKRIHSNKPEASEYAHVT
ncbi:hypothetical protein KSP40_PGU002071 [Platanthera guangdongensis]|uniref:Uncharacterized protein n=1 Tax=Platanthera guangdongensis TaxID=2320717 RepID=A0ABR2M1C7_9ASPA